MYVLYCDETGFREMWTGKREVGEVALVKLRPIVFNLVYIF